MLNPDLDHDSARDLTHIPDHDLDRDKNHGSDRDRDPDPDPDHDRDLDPVTMGLTFRSFFSPDRVSTPTTPPTTIATTTETMHPISILIATMAHALTPIATTAMIASVRASSQDLHK